MNKTIYFAVGIFLLITTKPIFASGSMNTTARYDKMLGTYHCVTHRMAGIRGRTDHRYAGRLRPIDGFRQFEIEISKSKFPSDTLNKKPWYEQCREMVGQSKFMQWMSCDAGYVLKSKDNQLISFMSGDTPRLFHGNPTGEFSLNSDLAFHIYQITLGSMYILEGSCSRLHNSSRSK